MIHQMHRRDFLKLAGIGGAVFVSGATLRAGQMQQDMTYWLVSDLNPEELGECAGLLKE